MSTVEVPKLTPNQILALVVLMAEAREVTNSELKELAGFTLTGADNEKLEKQLGLVQTDRSHRPFSHQLTDHGWWVARALPLTPSPKEGRSAVRSLFTLLGNVSRSLDRLQLSHADFFKQTGDAADADDVATRIRAAYRELASAPGDWVGLADLRELLDGLDRAAVDDALRVLARHDGVRIIPVANTKALKDRDRVAALRIGEEDNHTLSIGTR